MTVSKEARKRKKRKHHRSAGRKSVMDGTRYYDREEYIPQYGYNPNSCPTENVVTPADVPLSQGDVHSKVQNPSCNCTGYGASLRSAHATIRVAKSDPETKCTQYKNVCLSGPGRTISDKRQ